jgi:hypothetical protein
MSPMEETDPREHTLRRLQALVTAYFEHRAEAFPTLLEIIEELEAAGYGSIEPKGYVDAGLGLEPRLAASKAAVLPLNEPAAGRAIGLRRYERLCRSVGHGFISRA